MKKIRRALLLSAFLVIYANVFAQPPAPAGFKWQKIEAMSDEFNNGNNFNTGKWHINNPEWPGRSPGLFEAKNVNQWGGQLKMTARKFKPWEVKDNPRAGKSPYKKWTHGGALIRSKAKTKYGYFETRMKANETFMSSTFWLINRASAGSGCTRRVTEADITENVGVKMPAAQPWVNNVTNSMFSTLHSRGISQQCLNQNPGWKNKMAQKSSPIGAKASSGFHTYGAWWKGPRELIMYLDGRKVNTIRPESDFNIDMSIFLVVETYDWNPAPFPNGQNQVSDAGGMAGNFDQRTTDYDYVRSWKLVRTNAGGGNPGGGGIPYDKEIAIRSVSGNGNPFLQVNPNTGANVATAGTSPPNQAWQTWERFVPKRHPNGQTALYSLANNRYLQVNGNNKNVQVKAGGPAKSARPLAWERFEWRGLGGRRFALRSTVPTLAPTQWLQRAPNTKGVFPKGGAPKLWETFEYTVLPNQRGRKVLNEENALGVNIYPNPVNQGEDISIDSQLPESGAVSVAVFDLTGAQVYENNSDNVQVGATLPINTADFASGIYIVKVVSNGITETQKLVIK